MEKVTPNIFAITDIKGCNPGYVITSDGIVLIDTPQLPSKAIEMREEILKKGPVRYLINTEQHVDHIFGNHYFAGLCPVVAHQDTLEDFWITTFGQDPYDRSMDAVVKSDPGGLALMPEKKDYVMNTPTITFQDRMTLYVGHHVFELFHTPGHTRGQIAVYVPQERTVFTGDTIFSNCQSFFQSADPEGWLKSLSFLKTLDIDFIVPGHGPICSKDYILVQSAFIREWLASVAAGIAKGWSKEECMERISFLERFPMDVGHEGFGPALQRANVDHIYNFLVGNG